MVQMDQSPGCAQAPAAPPIHVRFRDQERQPTWTSSHRAGDGAVESASHLLKSSTEVKQALRGKPRVGTARACTCVAPKLVAKPNDLGLPLVDFIVRQLAAGAAAPVQAIVAPARLSTPRVDQVQSEVLRR